MKLCTYIVFIWPYSKLVNSSFCNKCCYFVYLAVIKVTFSMKSSRYKRCRFILSTSFFLTYIPLFSLANTPSEMADLSLQELFALSTDEMDIRTYEAWNFNFLYKRSELDGYLKGDNKISNDEVYFDGEELRTDENYPILPTIIRQESYIANVSYYLAEEQSISLSLPYIVQSTDHISLVTGYDEFNISSDGIGDITVNFTSLLKKWDNEKISLSVGLSMPTGSIDEKGDTPRATGDQQLPYTMQLGSGTWDIPLGVSYISDKEFYTWGANLFAKFRSGRNDRDYRLGNRFAASLWGKWHASDIFQPSMKVVFQDWGRIVGQDNEITVPNPKFPYPAGITNPRNYGGQKINLMIGGDILLYSQSFTVELGKAIYQNLNGIQPKERLNFSINWQSNF